MPVIAFASPKGGAGKSTTCLQVAGELLNSGAEVTIVDADPNRPFHEWQVQSQENGIMPDGLTVVLGDKEDELIDIIDTAVEKTPFVLVDLEGSANMGVIHSISRADLVIVPIKGSRLDANQAQRSVGVVRQTERTFRRTIPLSILITQTSAAIRGKTLQTVVCDIRNAEVPVFDTELLQREVFVTLFDIGGTLYTIDRLDPPIVSEKMLGAARANTHALTKEILQLLERSMEDAA